MPKSTVSFVCQECGYDSPQWLGKCPECGSWNSFKEFKKTKAPGLSTTNEKRVSSTNVRPKTLSEIHLRDTERIGTGFTEMDTVLGGGIVPGSVTLLAGDPGIGKSTLLLQLAMNVSSDRTQIKLGESESRKVSKSEGQKKIPSDTLKNSDTSESLIHRVPSEYHPKVLYISGEESVEQIKLRAMRIKTCLPCLPAGKAAGREKYAENLLLLSLTDTDTIAQIIEQENPSFVIIDSVQTMESEALGGLSGSVGQVRYAATAFIRAAKTLSIPVIIVGHVTKEGMVAGPMVLSHMVDTVLFLEGEKFTKTRILRSLKNRFGPVDEVGVFLMEGEGMNEVKNPEQLFLTERNEQVPGSVLVVIMEGTRPFLIEIQALVVYSPLAMPRRVAAGFDHKRLELLLAVLQKQCKLKLDTMDVFVNIAGGIKVSDPAIDLGICLAVYSSLKNRPLPKTIGIAEVGLLGELRGVGGLEKRIREGNKLGFRTIITPNDFKTLPDVLRSFETSQNSNIETSIR